MSDCDQVTDALAEGRALDGVLVAHAASCAECRAMTNIDRALGTMARVEAGDEAMPAALRAAMRDLRPVSGFSAWQRALPVAAVALGVMALVLVAVPRADLAHQPTARIGLGLAALLGGLAVSLTLLLHGGRYGLGLTARARLGFVAVAFAAFEVMFAALTVPVEGSLHLEGAVAWQARLGCALHGSLFAAVAGLVVFYGARRSAAVSPSSAGAVAGLAAGLVGSLAQHLQCPVMDLDHTLFAHIAPMIAGVAAGALAGRRWLAP